jgi:hypothetical protein
MPAATRLSSSCAALRARAHFGGQSGVTISMHSMAIVSKRMSVDLLEDDREVDGAWGEEGLLLGVLVAVFVLAVGRPLSLDESG